MTGKRQHYVPQFLLRRFAIEPENKKSMIFRLDIHTGQPRKANPVNEAVRGYYYRMESPDGGVDDTPDALLDRIENEAAKRLDHLLVDHRPAYDDRAWIARFIASLKLRTPEGREQLHETDIRMAELLAEERFSDPERVPSSVSNEEREQLLGELRAGRIEFESTPTREIGLMFAGVEHTAEFIATKMRWTLVRAPTGHPFLLSDHPVAHYDPTPKFDGAGWGYASSDSAMTLIPLDVSTALLLQPAENWHLAAYAADEEDVDDINLLVYAQATNAIYGPSQKAVVAVRRHAKTHPRRLADYRLRPPRLWVTTTRETDDNPVRVFRSTYKEDSLEVELSVSSQALKEAREGAESGEK